MRRTAVSFGLVALICLALTGYIAGQIEHVSFGHKVSFSATFDDVTGLQTGDPVNIAGVPVGTVQGVKVVDGRARVHFSVNASVALPSDTVVAVQWRNLIGQREVYLYPGTSSAHLTPGTEITRTRSVVDLGALINELGPLTQSLNPGQVNDLVTALVTALNGNVGNVGTIVSDLNTVLGTLAQRKQTLAQLISDYQTLTGAVAHRDLQIQTAVDNLAALSGAFAQSDQVLDNALVELPQLSTNLDRLLSTSGGDLGRIIDNLSLFTGVAHQRVGDLETLLHNLPPALADLFQVTGNGHFLAVNTVCFALQRPPCPYPITLAAARGAGPLTSTASFRSTLVGAAP